MRVFLHMLGPESPLGALLAGWFAGCLVVGVFVVVHAMLITVVTWLP